MIVEEDLIEDIEESQKNRRQKLSSATFNRHSSFCLSGAGPRCWPFSRKEETLFDPTAAPPVNFSQNYSSTRSFANRDKIEMESPRKREFFENGTFVNKGEEERLMAGLKEEILKEEPVATPPPTKSRRKSAKPTKIFVKEEEIPEEIIEEIHSDPLPEDAFFPKLSENFSPTQNDDAFLLDERLDIHKIKHYDNCREKIDGEIVPLDFDEDIARLQRSSSNHVVQRKKEIHVKLSKNQESPKASSVALLHGSNLPQTIDVVATVNVKTASSNNNGLNQKIPPTTPANLDALREKAVAIKSCMELTQMEVQQLILGGLVVKVSNRKKPDQSLKYNCKFCIWYNHDTNGQVKLRSFGRKEEIKRHHMLHLRYERFQCQYCPYKVVRSDHLHRHMKNKHPEVNHPGPQSTRSKRPQLDYDLPPLDFPPTMVTDNLPGRSRGPVMQNDFLSLIQNSATGANIPAQLLQSFLNFQRLAQTMPGANPLPESDEAETAEITIESDNEEESTISGSS
ncbi:Oidioi.mRNA.OKI2018_I69.PAR.g9167.t1.cds [Oikopleura dioica]|uniref:Oidioi.mRNA.OKI2018_I69.PAR.g9167.t1.cds n=1 Tax=Oikopleura dioica TaxID=34765 RepID=A0ABN7RNF3_OIKDI|nr:Oidioi.mRNA.OKI2018_I69.PAR.g9167.t1.cds [Oikopleura dioica]